jgi:membrane protease YdiL (CAAX protease family)
MLEEQLKDNTESPFNNEAFWERVNKKPTFSFFSQFAILIGLIGTGVIIGSLITIFMMTSLTHTSLMNIEKAMLDPKNANITKTVQIVGTFFMFFFPVFMYAVIVSNKPFKHIGFNKNISWKQIGIVTIIAVAGLFLSGALAELNTMIPLSKKLATTFKKWEDAYSDQVVAMMQIKGFADYLFSLLTIAIVPAIIEEALFRGGLQQLLVKWSKSPWTGIIITSIIFSAIHISFYGFLSRFMLGMVLGLIFQYTQNLWLNILMHFINNGISVTALYFYSMKGKLTKESMNDDNYPLWVGLIALIVIIGLFKLLIKESNTVIHKANLKTLPITE